MSEFDYLGDIQAPPQQDFDKLPDGDYKCRLENILIDQKQWGKELVIKWQVTEGQFAKRWLWINNTIPSPSERGTDKYEYSMNALGRTANKLNPMCKSFGEFLDQKTHAQYLDKFAVVTLKTNQKGYQNAYIKNMIADTPAKSPQDDPFAS